MNLVKGRCSVQHLLVTFLFVVSLSSGASAAAYPCDWLKGKVSGDRSGLYFFAEGFTEADRPKYGKVVDDLVWELFGDGVSGFGQEPFGSFREAFRVYRLWTPSNESGVFDRIIRDTWLQASFDPAGIPDINNVGPTSEGLVNFPDPSHRCPNDTSSETFKRYAVVIMNDTGNHGAITYPVYRYLAVGIGRSDRSTVFFHEMGHLFGGLGEEYTVAPYGNVGRDESPSANTTKFTVRDSIPWKAWIEDTTPIPTPWPSGTVGLDSVIGVYEGANQAEKGWYRPAKRCVMNINGFSYCRVCRERLTFSTQYNSSGRIAMDTLAPLPGTTVKSGWVVVRQIRSSFHPNRAKWTLDGQDLGIVSDSIEVDRLPRSGTLRAVLVSDTVYVRNPKFIIRDTLTWNVTKSAGMLQRSGINGGVRRLAPALFQVPSELLSRLRLFDAVGSRVEPRIVGFLPDGMIVGSEGAGGRKLFVEVSAP